MTIWRGSVSPLSTTVARANPYDSLIERLLSEGRNMFTAPEIQGICEAGGAMDGPGIGLRCSPCRHQEFPPVC